MVKVPPRISTVLSGSLAPAHGGRINATSVMKGYSGHIPGRREVVATSYRGPAEGNAYRGPHYPPAAYVKPLVGRFTSTDEAGV